MGADLSRSVSPRGLWGWAIAIALVGTAARVGWYLHFQDVIELRLGPNGDEFIQQARAFLNGGVVDPNAPGIETNLRETLPPGYGLVLAGIWDALTAVGLADHGELPLLAVYVAQWTLAALATLMTFALARRVLIGWTALLPLALMTLSVALVDLPNMLGYETLLMFLMTATVLALVKATEGSPLLWLPIGGLAYSMAIIAQPGVALLLIFAAWWLVNAMHGRFAALFLIVALVLPCLWLVRNYVVLDEVTPISLNTQSSLYYDNYQPIGGPGFDRNIAPPECPHVQLADPDLAAHVRWAKCMAGNGLDEWAGHPDVSARAVPDRLTALMSPWWPQVARGQYRADLWGYQELLPKSLRSNAEYEATRSAMAAALMTAYALLMLAGIWSLWQEGRGSAPRMIALPLLTLPLVHLLFHAENRFRVPLLPLICIAIVLGAISVFEYARPAPGNN